MGRKNRKKAAALFLLCNMCMAVIGDVPVYGIDTVCETESSEPRNPRQIHLGIDNTHVYQGMGQSFSEGYQPKIKDNSMILVVPFTADGSLKDDRLTASLVFADEGDSPFVFKNYQKEVQKKKYALKKGVMREITDGGQSENGTIDADLQETYLYECQVPLQETASFGQYSVTVTAFGYTEQMEKVSLEYQVFVNLSGNGKASQAAEGGNFGDGKAGESSENSAGANLAGEGAAQELVRQPKMLLERSSVSERTFLAGSTEQIELVFKNRSEEQAMYNLKVTASIEAESVWLTDHSFYFAKVSQGGTIRLESSLKVAADAKKGMIPMIFEFEYEDKNGIAATGTETVFLSIDQPVKMELEAADIPSTVFASDTIELSLKALNLSRTAVYNVRISLSAGGFFPKEDIFIGNMEAGTEGSGVMRVYVGTRTMEEAGVESGESDEEKYGSISGTITLQYEDAGGETHEIEKEFQSEIKKAQILALEVEDEKEANAWWLSVFAVAIAGMAAWIVFLMLRLRKKNVLLEEAGKGEL